MNNKHAGWLYFSGAGDFFPPLILSLPIFHVWFQSLLPQSNKCLEIFKWVSAPEHTWTGKSRAWDPPSPQTPKSQGPCIHDFNNFSLLHRLCITSDYLMISVHVQTHSKSNSYKRVWYFCSVFFFPTRRLLWPVRKYSECTTVSVTFSSTLVNYHPRKKHLSHLCQPQDRDGGQNWPGLMW